MRTGCILGSEKIGLRSYSPSDASNATNTGEVGWNNATCKEERQKFMNLQRPRSGFRKQALYGMIAIMCVASLQWSSPLILAQEETTTTEEAPQIPNEQLDSLVAPIALYPDAMLAQTLAASTYPLEVMQRHPSRYTNKNLKTQVRAHPVAQQPRAPSVESMAALPDVVPRT